MELTEDSAPEGFEAVPDALVGIDHQGQVRYVNSAAEELFGWAREELTGKTTETLIPSVPGEDHPLLRGDVTGAGFRRSTDTGFIVNGRRRDGSEFLAGVALGVVTSGDALVLATVRDLTHTVGTIPWREAQDEAHRLESLGQLAGGIAHDFNNLLGVILNCATLASRRVSDPAAAADIREICAAADQGAALSRQLLTFARRDIGHPEVVDIAEVVRATVSLLERTLGQHIKLVLDISGTTAHVNCDRGHIEQTLLNLALNARDAMPEGGELTISLDRGRGRADDAADCVRLMVTDTGCGMSAEVVSRAFEPFFTSKSGGTGLGLATVYGIAVQNGGNAFIRSTVGVGTSVIIELPITQAPAVAAPAARAAQGGTEKVLVVEDQDALRVLTGRILTEAGYSVVLASDGIDALEFVEHEAGMIDLVVTDLAMPRMGGRALADELQRRWPRIRVLFMTGFASGGTPAIGRTLAKPIAGDDLLLAARDALDE